MIPLTRQARDKHREGLPVNKETVLSQVEAGRGAGGGGPDGSEDSRTRQEEAAAACVSGVSVRNWSKDLRRGVEKRFFFVLVFFLFLSTYWLSLFA